MSDLSPLLPGRAVPALKVPALDGGVWRLADQKPEHFSLVIFYRGLHCPLCGLYLKDLDHRLGEFARRGVGVVAISADDGERAEAARARWPLEHLAVGYGLDLVVARRWGLFISRGRGPTSVGVEEPALFCEPGLFLVRPDGTLYFATVQTMPFARPHFDDILKALDIVIDRGSPPRGDVADLAEATGRAI